MPLPILSGTTQIPLVGDQVADVPFVARGNPCGARVLELSLRLLRHPPMHIEERPGTVWRTSGRMSAQKCRTASTLLILRDSPRNRCDPSALPVLPREGFSDGKEDGQGLGDLPVQWSGSLDVMRSSPERAKRWGARRMAALHGLRKAGGDCEKQSPDPLRRTQEASRCS